jgi:hypothetical protein
MTPLVNRPVTRKRRRNHDAWLPFVSGDLAPRSERSPESVRLLLDIPEESYRTIAVIQSRPQNLFRGVESLKAEVRAAAARLGADAVVLSLASSGDPGGTGTTPMAASCSFPDPASCGSWAGLSYSTGTHDVRPGTVPGS